MSIGAALLAFLLVLAACGDDSSDPLFGTTGGQATSGSNGTTGSNAGGGGTAATTTTAEPATAMDFIANADFTPSGEGPGSSVGTPDFQAAEAIAADLFAGADSTGMGIWVFPVIGSDEVLLVLEIDGDLVAEDSGDIDLFDILANATSVTDAGITRLVFNFNTTDTQGDLIITATVLVEAILESEANDTDLAEDAVEYQITRDGVTQ